MNRLARSPPTGVEAFKAAAACSRARRYKVGGHIRILRGIRSGPGQSREWRLDLLRKHVQVVQCAEEVLGLLQSGDEPLARSTARNGSSK